MKVIHPARASVVTLRMGRPLDAMVPVRLNVPGMTLKMTADPLASVSVAEAVGRLFSM